MAEIERQSQMKAGRRRSKGPDTGEGTSQAHLQQQLNPQLTDRTRGKTLRQGFLVKQGNSIKTWRKRWFALIVPPNRRDPPCLVYYQSKPSQRARPLNVIILAEGVVIQTHPDHFEIDTSTRTFFLRAGSPEDCAGWVHAIASVLPPLDAGEEDEDEDLLDVQGKARLPTSDSASPPPPAPVSRSTFHTAAPVPQFPKSKLAPLSTPHSSTPILEGYLIKEGQRIKTKKRRWFLLRSQVLIYYDDHFKREPLGTIYLRHVFGLVRTQPKSGEPEYGYGFELATPGRLYPLVAETPKDLDLWVDCISRVVNHLALRMAIESDSDSLLFDEDDENEMWDKPVEERDWTLSNSESKEGSKGEAGEHGGTKEEEEEEEEEGGEEEVFDVEDPFGGGAQFFSSGIDPSAEPLADLPPPTVAAKGLVKPIPVLFSTQPLPANSELRKVLDPSSSSASSRPTSTASDDNANKTIHNTIELLNDLMDTLDDLDQFLPVEIPGSKGAKDPKPPAPADIDVEINVDDIMSALDDLQQSF